MMLYVLLLYCVQVEPGKRGRKFQKGNNYKPKKEVAYRLCGGRPTSAMPKRRFLWPKNATHVHQ